MINNFIIFRFTCEPIPQKDAICNVTGRIINTFDGTEIKFDICSHILARDIVKEKWAVICKYLEYKYIREDKI